MPGSDPTRYRSWPGPTASRRLEHHDAVLDDRPGQVPVLLWPAMARFPLRAVVTTRVGGVSQGPYTSFNLGLHVGDDVTSVLENRARAARLLDLTLDDLVFANQVHGREVGIVGATDRGRGTRQAYDAVDGVDALVTATPDVGLAILVADCVPVLLYDRRAHVLGCVHAGWRGTVARAVDAALGAMARLGSVPDDVWAALGPAIPASDYVVGDEVIEAVRRAFGSTEGLTWRDEAGAWHADLAAANRRLLVDAGVPAAHVLGGPPAGTTDARWFSDRRERPCGRFGLLACLLPR